MSKEQTSNDERHIERQNTESQNIEKQNIEKQKPNMKKFVVYFSTLLFLILTWHGLFENSIYDQNIDPSYKNLVLGYFRALLNWIGYNAILTLIASALKNLRMVKSKGMSWIEFIKLVYKERRRAIEQYKSLDDVADLLISPVFLVCLFLFTSHTPMIVDIFSLMIMTLPEYLALASIVYSMVPSSDCLLDYLAAKKK